MENNRSHQNSFYSCRTTINVKTLIIIGDNEVGKSCIIKSLTKKKKVEAWHAMNRTKVNVLLVSSTQ